jgi:hypothetical protein
VLNNTPDANKLVNKYKFFLTHYQEMILTVGSTPVACCLSERVYEDQADQAPKCPIGWTPEPTDSYLPLNATSA